MSSHEMGIEQARPILGPIADRARYAGQVTYLTRNGSRLAAVVPLDRIRETAMASTDGRSDAEVAREHLGYEFTHERIADEFHRRFPVLHGFREAGLWLYEQSIAASPDADDLDKLHDVPEAAQAIKDEYRRRVQMVADRT